MFTGIVEQAAPIENISAAPDSIRLSVRSSFKDVKTGDSIAINGCCLTVANDPEKSGSLEFDLLRETWIRTSLQFAKSGQLVNLERSLQTDGRIHGHFVTGHIDGIGQIRIFEKRGADWFLSISVPPEILHYIVLKGAVALDGISLTIADVTTTDFSVWIIPHTYEVTALHQRMKGEHINVEVDMLAKYVEKFVQFPK
jgi:riboflavin synthase